jgi:hypothetical protein
MAIERAFSKLRVPVPNVTSVGSQTAARVRSEGRTTHQATGPRRGVVALLYGGEAIDLLVQAPLDNQLAPFKRAVSCKEELVDLNRLAEHLKCAELQAVDHARTASIARE